MGRNPDGDQKGIDGFRNVFKTYTAAFPDCRIELGDSLSLMKQIGAA